MEARHELLQHQPCTLPLYWNAQRSRLKEYAVRVVEVPLAVYLSTFEVQSSCVCQL